MFRSGRFSTIDDLSGEPLRVEYAESAKSAPGSGVSPDRPNPSDRPRERLIGHSTANHGVGNTDGDASEIYSETMGAIFSYAAGCHLVSNAASYFIGPDVALDIQNSLLIGAGGLTADVQRLRRRGGSLQFVEPLQRWNRPDAWHCGCAWLEISGTRGDAGAGIPDSNYPPHESFADVRCLDAGELCSDEQYSGRSNISFNSHGHCPFLCVFRGSAK